MQKKIVYQNVVVCSPHTVEKPAFKLDRKVCQYDSFHVSTMQKRHHHRKSTNNATFERGHGREFEAASVEDSM